MTPPDMKAAVELARGWFRITERINARVMEGKQPTDPDLEEYDAVYPDPKKYDAVCRALLSLVDAEPVAYMVHRDTDYDSREYFRDEASARANACLGVVDTHISPLIAKPEVKP
jgi:hypothetical protein